MQARLAWDRAKRRTRSAWVAEAVGLLKSHGNSPGLPLAPHPEKPRAPRVPAVIDPVEQARHGAMPYKFKPHRLSDLDELHKEDTYEPQHIAKVPVPSYVAKDKPSITPAFRMLKAMLTELRLSLPD